MTTAHKVIDWNGRDDGAVLREVHALPPGRYRLVPVADDAWDLSTDDEAYLEYALDEVAHEIGIPAQDVRAELRTKHGS